MAKQSRRKNRRGRRRAIIAKQERKGLRVSVFTSPQVKEGQVTLGEDLRLVRSALLYADEVELISPGASSLQPFAGLAETGDVDASALFSSLDDTVISQITDGDHPPELIKQVFAILPTILSWPEDRRRAVISEAQEVQYIKGLQDVQAAMGEAGQIAHELRASAGATELDLAISDGALSVASAGFSIDHPVDEQVQWYADRLRSALSSPAGALLLDERTVELMREQEFTPKFDLVGERANRAATGTGLIERLPVFPDASMADVLAVREELAEGRVQYRVAVKRLASQLASAPFDETVSNEIDELWNDEVRPELRSMQDTVRLSRLAKNTGRDIVNNYRSEVISSSVLMVAVESLAQLSWTTSGAAAVGANVAWQATAQVLRARADVQKHELFYLLDVDKHLGSSGL